jgi:hypothetical protein
MPGITDEIIKSQKEFEKAIAEAKKQQAAVERAAKEVISTSKGWEGLVDSALKTFNEATRTVDDGLRDLDLWIKDAEAKLKGYDMLKRKAKDAEDYLTEMKEQAAKAEKAAKANKGDKQAQKDAELAAKALEKAEKEVKAIASQLRGTEEQCKDPLNYFNKWTKQDFEKALIDRRASLVQLSRMLHEQRNRW